MTNQEAIDLLDNLIGMIEDNHGSDYDSAIRMAIDALEPQWIPVSQELPEDGKVVIAIGKKGTWDVGTYRGFLGDNIHRWQWKKNTIKTVYWWMYKENALPEPYKGDEE